MRYIFFIFCKKVFSVTFFHITLFFSANNVYFVKNTNIFSKKKKFCFNLVLQEMNIRCSMKQMFFQKKRNNKYLRRSSFFSEVTGCRSLVYFKFPTLSMLTKMRNISFSGITHSGCFFQHKLFSRITLPGCFFLSCE